MRALSAFGVFGPIDRCADKMGSWLATAAVDIVVLEVIAHGRQVSISTDGKRSAMTTDASGCDWDRQRRWRCVKRPEEGFGLDWDMKRCKTKLSIDKARA